MTRLSAALLAPALLLIPAAHAQITIGQAEMPDAGNQIARVQAATNPFLNYGATGPAHTWNFSNLSATGGDNTVYQTVASTNFVYAIAYANLPFNPNRANQAKQGVDIPFSNLLPISDPYTFRYRSGSVYKTVGFGAEVSGIPLPIIFSQHDVIYNLPLHYGDSTFSHSAYSIDIPSVGSYGFQQDRINQVDGWGAITTPAGTFDVLRVKTTLHATDDLMGMTINRPVVREYKWLAQGLRTPVLQINTTSVFGAEVVTGVWYYDAPRSITVVQPLASTLCPGSALSVHYEVTGAFNAGGILIPANQFRAQLSDASGSFANPVTIGSVQATGAGTIAATIPPATPPGTGYRIRVVSTSPAFTGTSNMFDITIGGAATAAISSAGPAQACTGSAVTLTAVGGPDYQWQLDGVDIPGAVGETYEAAVAGSYTATVTNACGTATSNAIAVTVNDPPAVSVEATELLSCASAPATITALSPGDPQGLLFQWYLNQAPIAGADGLSVQVSLSGQYALEATDPATGCSALTDGVMVTVATVDAPALSALGDTAFCDGGAVELNAAEMPGMSYQWTLDGEAIAGATGTSLTASQAGTYGVTATDADGCGSEASTIALTVHALPDAPAVTADGPTAFCEGGEVLLSAGGAADGFQWYLDGQAIDQATESELLVSASGAYALQAISAEGCLSPLSAPVEVSVEAYPPVAAITADGPAAFCEGGSVTLTAEAVAGASYQWWLDGAPIAGATGTELTVDATGSYAVVLSTSAGCETPGGELEVTVHPAPEQPVLALHADSLVATGSGGFQWFLDGAPIDGATAYWWIPAEDGYYTVQVTDANGCTSTSEAWFHLGTGVDAADRLAVRAYPNPTAGSFTVEAPGAEGLPYEVCDLTGARVRSGILAPVRTRIDLSAAAPGVYFVRFPGGGMPVLRIAVAR